MAFTNTIGLFALLSLIPFIILYMRRPKPQDRIIPSLMFLIKEQKMSKRYSFLRRFLTNLLFFVQLLIFIGLSFAVASPFIRLPYDVSLENTVIILDASASMQAQENGKMRFDNAIKEAKSTLSGRNSIILAESIPLIILEEEDEEVALDILGSLEPKATATNLGDAILLARDLLEDKPGRIVVISDFANVNIADLLVVKRATETDERIVNFVDVSNKAGNVGIINMEVRKHSIKAYIKNFNDEEKTVKLKLTQGKEVLAESGKIKILPNSVESFIFDDTPTGISAIEIEPKDNFPVDDIAYISAPLKKQVNVLLITNRKNTNLETALRASRDIALNVVNPPVLTINTEGDKVEPYKHDVIIVHEVNNVNKRDGILPGTFQDLSSYAKNGGNLIITAQNDLEEINLHDAKVVNIKNRVEDARKVCLDVVNQLTKQFGNEPCFATIGRYFNAEAAVGTLTIASIDKIPILALKGLQKGKVFYYGLIDDASDFETLPSYPIFWNELINFMAEIEDIRDFNFKTGRVITVNEQKVKTPSSTLTTSKIIFDEAGIYEYGGKKFAANLLDEKESGINVKGILEKEKAADILEEEGRERNFSLDVLLLSMVFLLMCFEVFYIKRRGDL
ncbi:BatA and WFA domain-containing protein [Candidatus Woesearchaeota archaeon]|nr:BatA and WFA domain-containing protein [Candidatus Woesearchaeota archaeon]